MTPELERLAIEMYVRGLSTRDIEDTFKNKDGKNLISKDGISQITEALSEEYERFCSRELSGMTLSTYSLMPFMKVCV